METWRIVAAALLGVSGIIGVLIITARVRERTRKASGAAVAALVSFTLLFVLTVLTITVLPGVAAWVITVGVTVAVGVGLLAS